jgi:hypothetical protein
MQMQDPEMEPDEGNHSTDALQFYGAAGETYVHVSSDTTHASGVLCLCIIMMVMQVHSAGHRRDKLVLLDLRLEAIQLPDLLLAILAGTLAYRICRGSDAGSTFGWFFAGRSTT